MRKLIGLSNFVKRQTKESNYSYYSGTSEELLNLVEHAYHNHDIECGYRDGVVLVNVPEDNFYSALVPLTPESQLVTRMVKRQPNELAMPQTNVINAEKAEAKHVQIVLYRADVLQEDNDRSTDAEWEIISINASPYTDNIKIPLHPITMMRNELHLVGGTKATYTKEEYIEATKFWSQHANVERGDNNE